MSTYKRTPKDRLLQIPLPDNRRKFTLITKYTKERERQIMKAFPQLFYLIERERVFDDVAAANDDEELPASSKRAPAPACKISHLHRRARMQEIHSRARVINYSYRRSRIRRVFSLFSFSHSHSRFVYIPLPDRVRHII